MTEKELYNALRKTHFPVAHNAFEKRQSPPYVIYTNVDYKTVAANSKQTLTQPTVCVELYINRNDVIAESKIESVLNELTTYSKSKSYISEEKVYLIRYEFEL